MSLMPAHRCQSCRTQIDPEQIASRAALVYSPVSPRPLLALCPPCARAYREATDAIPRRPDALIDGERLFPALNSNDPHGPKILPERYQFWARDRRAPGDPDIRKRGNDA